MKISLKILSLLFYSDISILVAYGWLWFQFWEVNLQLLLKVY